jgi:hypothetical protein
MLSNDELIYKILASIEFFRLTPKWMGAFFGGFHGRND